MGIKESDLLRIPLAVAVITVGIRASPVSRSVETLNKKEKITTTFKPGNDKNGCDGRVTLQVGDRFYGIANGDNPYFQSSSEETSVNTKIEQKLTGDVIQFDNSFLVVKKDGTLGVRARTESASGTQEEVAAWRDGQYDWKPSLIEVSPGVYVTPWQEIENIGRDGKGYADRFVFQVLTDGNGQPITETRYGVAYTVLESFHQGMRLPDERNNPSGGFN